MNKFQNLKVAIGVLRETALDSARLARAAGQKGLMIFG
jgi:hypothetical protein